MLAKKSILEKKAKKIGLIRKIVIDHVFGVSLYLGMDRSHFFKTMVLLANYKEKMKINAIIFKHDHLFLNVVF